MTLQEEVPELQKQQLDFFQELEKRQMEFMEKMLTQQKKSDEAEKEDFLAVMKNILWKMNYNNFLLQIYCITNDCYKI